MPQVFQATVGFEGPDGTHVFPFLNSNDVFSGLDAGLLDEFSLAIGEIKPRSESKIHVHPEVSQVTMVLNGRLELKRRQTGELEVLQLAEHQAALTRPGGFLQLINRSVFPCRLLYVVAPAYVFEVDDNGDVVYDDSISLDESWDELEAADWQPKRLTSAGDTEQARRAAVERLRRRPR